MLYRLITAVLQKHLDKQSSNEGKKCWSELHLWSTHSLLLSRSVPLQCFQYSHSFIHPFIHSIDAFSCQHSARSTNESRLSRCRPTLQVNRSNRWRWMIDPILLQNFMWIRSSMLANSDYLPFIEFGRTDLLFRKSCSSSSDISEREFQGGAWVDETMPIATSFGSRWMTVFLSSNKIFWTI